MTPYFKAGLERQNMWVRVPALSNAFILPRFLLAFYRLKSTKEIHECFNLNNKGMN
jgi:hypothetical protein